MPGLNESAFSDSNLCVVGNLNRDLKTAPLRAGEHLFHDGETSVASLVETIGGGGANSACTAAGLGAKVAFIGKIGMDSLGARLEQTLARQNVQPVLKKDASLQTGTTLALTFYNGHRHFLSCLPNNEAFAFEDIDLAALDGFDRLYRADIWFSKPMLFGGNERLFKEARARGLQVSMDLNWDPYWGIASAEEIRARKEAVRSVLPLVNIAHGNVRELKKFSDAPNLDEALRRLAQWGTESVVVHLGAKGAGWFHSGQLQVEPPVPAKCQVNTTGTGDVLSICMMLLHQQGKPAEQLRLANRVVTEFIEGRRQFIPTLV